MSTKVFTCTNAYAELELPVTSRDTSFVEQSGMPDLTGVSTEIWGPKAWGFLHAITFRYPEKDADLEDRRALFEFLVSLKRLIPCTVCRAHYTSYIDDRNVGIRGTCSVHLENRAAAARWMYDLHNAVNERLGKQQVDFASVEMEYSGTHVCPAPRAPADVVQADAETWPRSDPDGDQCTPGRWWVPRHGIAWSDRSARRRLMAGALAGWILFTICACVAVAIGAMARGRRALRDERLLRSGAAASLRGVAMLSHVSRGVPLTHENILG